jgi:hypothetical protein
MANIVPDSFKQELFLGTHNFSTSAGDTFQLALYTTVTGFLKQEQLYTLLQTKLVELVILLQELN